ncbi:MAG: hypothetical protein COV36_04430 [Alphaproteobacteria bacterium CG11_big_fil_rev_8_21_14_0_20_44_7]|nr:MAG: hypothetical protein COV36_04430 [Alphaproteobacteria bacterium CG11_big_fil_rev_8_21_14_0_20_44_7]
MSEIPPTKPPKFSPLSVDEILAMNNIEDFAARYKYAGGGMIANDNVRYKDSDTLGRWRVRTSREGKKTDDRTTRHTLIDKNDYRLIDDIYVPYYTITQESVSGNDIHERLDMLEKYRHRVFRFLKDYIKGSEIIDSMRPEDLSKDMRDRLRQGYADMAESDEAEFKNIRAFDLLALDIHDFHDLCRDYIIKVQKYPNATDQHKAIQSKIGKMFLSLMARKEEKHLIINEDRTGIVHADFDELIFEAITEMSKTAAFTKKGQGEKIEKTIHGHRAAKVVQGVKQILETEQKMHEGVNRLTDRVDGEKLHAAIKILSRISRIQIGIRKRIKNEESEFYINARGDAKTLREFLRKEINYAQAHFELDELEDNGANTVKGGATHIREIAKARMALPQSWKAFESTITYPYHMPTQQDNVRSLVARA